MAFRSRATTRAGVLQDLQSHMLRGYNSRGLVAPSTGTTRSPGTPPLSAADLFNNLDTLLGQQRITRGAPAGTELRPTGASTANGSMAGVGASYSSRRYEFISKEEGVRKYAYDDATGRRMNGPAKSGNVTIGIGFNMDRGDGREVFQRVFGGEVNYDAVYSGRGTLTDDQVQRLFDHTIQEFEGYVDQKFSGIALPEHRRLALLSLLFNGGPGIVGPRLVNAVRDGDWQTAVDSYLYRTGTQRNPRLRGRRYREASLLVGPSSASSYLPDANDYLS